MAVLSAAERDRRWGALREAMAVEGWAALVMAAGPDPGPVRYLSGNPELTAGRGPPASRANNLTRTDT